MRIDVAFLPALAAAFVLIFARIGTMVMLLPGLGELSVPVRVRLTIALAAVLLPLHRNAYALDPLSILAGFLILLLAVTTMMGVFLGSVENVLSALAPHS